MTDIFQLVVAFIYVLVVPGFAVTLAVFPRFNQLELTERLALSIGLSFTIVVALGLLLGYSETLIAITGGITAFSLIYGIGFITLFCLIIWALRRANLAVEDRRKAARPEREMVLDARTAKPPEGRTQAGVRPESRPQAEVRPRNAAAPDAARAEDQYRREEYRRRRGA